MAKSLDETVREDSARFAAAKKRQVVEAAIAEKSQQRYLIALNVAHGTGDQAQAEEALEAANTELENLESELEKIKAELGKKPSKSSTPVVN